LYGLHTVKVALVKPYWMWYLQPAHFFGALSVVTYNHCKTATAASCMTVMGSTLSRNDLIPRWERSSIRRLKVGSGQSGRGGVGGGGGMGRTRRDHLIEIG
jgi:hypothetical protein